MDLVSSSCTVLYSEAIYGSALYAYFEEKGKIREPSDSAGGSSRTELYLPKTVINVSHD